MRKERWDKFYQNARFLRVFKNTKAKSKGEKMLTSICGINWGDEGKGRMVDLLSQNFEVVCRYQGFKK